MIPISRQPVYYFVEDYVFTPTVMARPVAKPPKSRPPKKITTSQSSDREFQEDERVFQFEDRDESNRQRERDYFEELALAPESRYPDRYGWEQYHRGYYY